MSSLSGYSIIASVVILIRQVANRTREIIAHKCSLSLISTSTLTQWYKNVEFSSFKSTDLSFQFSIGSPYYALLNFASQNSRASHDVAVNDTSEEVASRLQENGASATYQNLTGEGNPVPGLSRGVVPHRRNYINTRSTASWYNKLQLIRPLAREWLRNAWGNVDQSGRHTYDVMQRDQHAISPYDKLHQTTQRDLAESSAPASSNLYNTLERPAAVLLPSKSQNASTTEDV